ncbi:MAG: hypothetical protein SPI77_00230 [Corynebacterium sp.]|nr:hypothetical protein [Corynebacterium sp.]
MRVYLPATVTMLEELAASEVISARSGWGFAVTGDLREFYTAGDEEELADIAFTDAARASLRLLAIGDDRFPARRVVLSVDLPDEQVTPRPDLGLTVVGLDPAQVAEQQVKAIHVDTADNEEATAAAIAVIDAADLGDEDAEIAVGNADDNLMAWYDPSELGVLVQLL